MSKSLRKAINNMCKDCSYDKYDKGTWRQQIAACTISECPLHEVRPVDEKYNGTHTTHLTIELLNHWQIKPEELDERARSILKDAPEGSDV